MRRNVSHIFKTYSFGRPKFVANAVLHNLLQELLAQADMFLNIQLKTNHSVAQDSSRSVSQRCKLFLRHDLAHDIGMSTVLPPTSLVALLTHWASGRLAGRLAGRPPAGNGRSTSKPSCDDRSAQSYQEAWRRVQRVPCPAGPPPSAFPATGAWKEQDVAAHNVDRRFCGCYGC